MTWTAVKIWRRDSAVWFYRVLFTTGDNGYWKKDIPSGEVSSTSGVFCSFASFSARFASLNTSFSIMARILDFIWSKIISSTLAIWKKRVCITQTGRIVQASTLIKMMCHFRQNVHFCQNNEILNGCSRFYRNKIRGGVKIDADSLLRFELLRTQDRSNFPLVPSPLCQC